MVLYGASKKYRAKVTKTDTGKVVTPSSTVKSKELINKYSGIVSGKTKVSQIGSQRYQGQKS